MLRKAQNMSRFVILATMLAFALLSGAAEIKLNNGDILKGEAASFSDDGVIVRLEIGGFSPRIPWGKLTQESLQSLLQNPDAREFVEPYIDVPLEVREQERRRRKEIRVTEPPSVPRVEGRINLFAAMANPLGFTLLGLLYAANLYSAVQIARFRGRPVGLVVAVSAIAPVIGPALFAAMPAVQAEGGEAESAAAPAATEGINPMQQALPAGLSGSGLGLAATGHGKAAGNPAYTTVHNRSNATFDRRFFETKFSGFFRVVPSDAEKDLVIVIKTAKKELVAVRVSRISASEAHFQLQRGSEESVPFSEIAEVSVRQKTAK